MMTDVKISQPKNPEYNRNIPISAWTLSKTDSKGESGPKFAIKRNQTPEITRLVKGQEGLEMNPPRDQRKVNRAPLKLTSFNPQKQIEEERRANANYYLTKVDARARKIMTFYSKSNV